MRGCRGATWRRWRPIRSVGVACELGQAVRPAAAKPLDVLLGVGAEAFQLAMLEPDQRAVGGWREDVLAEDTYLTYRLLLAGWQTVYQNRSECYEEVPQTWPVRVG